MVLAGFVWVWLSYAGFGLVWFSKEGSWELSSSLLQPKDSDLLRSYTLAIFLIWYLKKDHGGQRKHLDIFNFGSDL